jgi:hypothetical protein
MAQDDTFRFGGDAFATGGTVTLDESGLEDVFGAGERVELAAPVGGSAHLAGRRVVAGGDIGGSLYAMGADLTVSAPVAGNALLFGYDVAIGAAIGGNLRAAGRTVRLAAPVAGSALLAGDTVSIDAVIGGDAAIDAEVVDFGPGARIDGTLTLYGRDTAAVDVPASVAPADRIERRASDERPEAPSGMMEDPSGWLALAAGFVGGVLVLAVLVFLAALIAPVGMERLGARIADRPLRTLWIGFLTLAALIGATVLAILTVVGILAAPAIMLAIVLGCFVGWLVGVYLLGRGIWVWTGQLSPDTVGERALVALIGAVVVSLIALVPFLGWLLLMLLTVAGLGAVSVALFRPEFRA